MLVQEEVELLYLLGLIPESLIRFLRPFMPFKSFRRLEKSLKRHRLLPVSRSPRMFVNCCVFVMSDFKLLASSHCVPKEILGKLEATRGTGRFVTQIDSKGVKNTPSVLTSFSSPNNEFVALSYLISQDDIFVRCSLLIFEVQQNRSRLLTNRARYGTLLVCTPTRPTSDFFVELKL